MTIAVPYLKMQLTLLFVMVASAAAVALPQTEPPTYQGVSGLYLPSSDDPRGTQLAKLCSHVIQLGMHAPIPSTVVEALVYAQIRYALSSATIEFDLLTRRFKCTAESAPCFYDVSEGYCDCN